MIRAEFPERQFTLGDYVMVRTGTPNDLKYHYGLRVVKVINERIYDVQDQFTGDVFEADIKEMFVDATAVEKR